MPEGFKSSDIEARRKFLKNCATYAAAMPPAIALLVSADKAMGQAPSQGCVAICNDANASAKDKVDCGCPPVGPATTAPQFESSEPVDPEATNPEGN